LVGTDDTTLFCEEERFTVRPDGVLTRLALALSEAYIACGTEMISALFREESDENLSGLVTRRGEYGG
jgi:hypothetical protein